MSLADYINLGLVITALLAVYYQARAVRISEKELETQVRDIQALVQRLDAERQEREAQLASMIARIANERTARQAERDRDYVDLQNYSSSSYATAQKLSRGARQLADQDIVTLSQCLFVLAHPSTHFGADQELYGQRFSVVRRSLGAMLKLIGIHGKFDSAMTQASAAYETRRTGDCDSKNVDRNLGHFEADIEKAVKEMEAETTKAGEENQTINTALDGFVRELIAVDRP
jgi:uncharacterized protein YlxW (UPF0749 family)